MISRADPQSTPHHNVITRGVDRLHSVAGHLAAAARCEGGHAQACRAPTAAFVRNLPVSACNLHHSWPSLVNLVYFRVNLVDLVMQTRFGVVQEEEAEVEKARRRQKVLRICIDMADFST